MTYIFILEKASVCKQSRSKPTQSDYFKSSKFIYAKALETALTHLQQMMQKDVSAKGPPFQSVIDTLRDLTELCAL